MDELDNNATVKNKLFFVEHLVKDLLMQVVLGRVSYKPHCVNPLGLVSKVVSQEVEHSLILNESRLANTHVDLPMVKLAYLQKALLKVKKHDFLGVLDLKSCYFHIKIHPKHTWE